MNTNVVKKGGRPKGSLNRSTKQSREAIAHFVEESIPQFRGWLEQIARGIPKVNELGNVIRDGEGSVVWVVKPNPEAAIKAVTTVAEFHLPRLQRSDISATINGSNDLRSISTDELKRMLLEGEEADIIEGELIPDTQPAWMK